MDAKLPITLNVEVDGKKRDIFMSFALLNRLSYLIGNPDAIAMMQIEPSIREALMVELLMERDQKGKPLYEVTKGLDEYAISLDDVGALLDWASEHVLNFTVAATERTQALQARAQGRMDVIQSRLTPTQTGRLNKTF